MSWPEIPTELNRFLCKADWIDLAVPSLVKGLDEHIKDRQKKLDGSRECDLPSLWWECVSLYIVCAIYLDDVSCSNRSCVLVHCSVIQRLYQAVVYCIFLRISNYLTTWYETVLKTEDMMLLRHDPIIRCYVYMHGGYDDMDDEWLTPKWRWDQYGGGGGDDVWSKHPSATNSRTLVSPNPRLLHFCTNWHTTIHMGCQQMQSLIHTSHFYPEGLPQVVQCKKTPRLNFHETKVPAPRFSKTCSGRHWVPMKAAHILCIVDLGAVGVSASRSLIWWVDTIC